MFLVIRAVLAILALLGGALCFLVLFGRCSDLYDRSSRTVRALLIATTALLAIAVVALPILAIGFALAGIALVVLVALAVVAAVGIVLRDTCCGRNATRPTPSN